MGEAVQLPAATQRALDMFVEAAAAVLDSDLISVVLHGSAAEQRLRPTSDVNLILVLRQFDQPRIDRLREPMRFAHASIDLNVMFLLESEIDAAMEAFAVKFNDVLARHRILFGKDPFADLAPSREATRRRLQQVLLNFELRLRQRYVLMSLRDEQLSRLIAEAAGPLRSSAAALLNLEGQAAPSPKAALLQVVTDCHDPALTEAVEQISVAREGALLAPGLGGPTILNLMRVTQHLRDRLVRLPRQV